MSHAIPQPIDAGLHAEARIDLAKSFSALALIEVISRLVGQDKVDHGTRRNEQTSAPSAGAPASGEPAGAEKGLNGVGVAGTTQVTKHTSTMTRG
jgi:hypothetical protein